MEKDVTWTEGKVSVYGKSIFSPPVVARFGIDLMNRPSHMHADFQILDPGVRIEAAASAVIEQTNRAAALMEEDEENIVAVEEG